MSSERIIAQCIACQHRQELTEKPSPPVKCTECGHVANVYTSRQMTPEERERYQATKPAPRHPDDQQIKPPVVIQERTTKGDKSMPVNLKVPSRIEFLQQIAAGKSISKIEREWEMNAGSLHYWVGKWDLKGIKPERAQQLLDEAALDGGAVPPPQNEAQLPASAPIDLQKVTAELRAANDDLKQANLKIDNLKEQLDDEMRANDEAIRLLNETKQRQNLAEEKVAELTKSLEIAERTIAGLEHDHSLLLDTIERASAGADTQPVSPFPIVSLTYALVDFGGDSADQRKKALEEAEELIEELEPAAIDLKRTVAELYDAGQAFVGLIRKQLQELYVEDVDATVQRYFAEHNRRHLDKIVGKFATLEADSDEG